MAACLFDGCVFLVLAVAVGVNAQRPSSPEYQDAYTKNLESFSKTNLTYECYRYVNYNQVPECDCLACANARPDFLSKMCSFRASQEFPPPRRRTELDPANDWHKLCDSGSKCRLPTECCDPAKGIQVENGCPKCIPTMDCKECLVGRVTYGDVDFKHNRGLEMFQATEGVGTHASCFIAERYATKKSEIGWKRIYQHYADAVSQAKLSMKCISYAVARTANPCDCEPCLQSEVSTRSLREKLCEMGRVVRTKTELNRRDFWGHNDYFLNFCDFEKCPEMPRKCCDAPDDSTSTRLTYPVDSKGCPSCLPTSSLYGFGPGCEPRLKGFPQKTRDRVLELLKGLPQ